ncbi:GspH/FimT family protein [Lysobacter sp. K5869]|uniref:GspH/FimT family protein n=1 Tax=Lysobacter sp. K5869 TaxID=2820808 RepID=UPI001C060D02|nr:GspH/FimT family protein [Lysobacter sp. K5869]QWP79053.1 GspH/FimT family protein [Lysobacter sp. K5869]
MRIKRLDAYEFFAAFLLANLLSLLVSPAPQASFDGSPADFLAQGLGGLYAQAANHAARRAVPVVLCPVRWTYFQCDESVDWSQGLMGFADNDRGRRFNEGDFLLRRHLPLPSHLRLRLLGEPRPIRFEPGTGRVGYNAPLLLCDLRGPRAWVLRYRNTGGFDVRDAEAAELARCDPSACRPSTDIHHCLPPSKANARRNQTVGYRRALIAKAQKRRPRSLAAFSNMAPEVGLEPTTP